MVEPFRNILALFLVSFCVVTGLQTPARAQVRPVYDQGALGIAQSLSRLNTTASALMIGAHPDDEDSALLTYLARGENARTYYLSLTRGDGGQNILGTELGEALGVIRTEELLQARTLDGAGQLFARAYDYGFSKTLDEAKQKWDEKVILCDVVRVIRTTQPLVVISVFNGTASDGHGQHQYAGYISPLAVKAAADPEQCKETLPVWIVKKFYVRHRGSGEPSLRINTGKYDSLLGRSYFEIAMQARSQHRSQEQGVLELKGPQYSALTLIDSKVTSAPGAPIFDGIDTSIKGMTSLVDLPDEFAKKELLRLDELMRRSLAEYDPRKPSAIVPLLAEAWRILEAASKQRVEIGSGGIARSTRLAASLFLGGKAIDLMKALNFASGVDSLVLAQSDTATPGSTIRVSVATFEAYPEITNLVDINWHHPDGWSVTKISTDSQTAAGGGRRDEPTNLSYYDVKIPENATITQPYWLFERRLTDLYNWSARPPQWPNLEGLSFAPPPLFAEIKMETNGIPFTVFGVVRYRYADDIRGEIKRELNVVPKLAVAFDKNLVIASTHSASRDHELSVSVTNNLSGAVNGHVEVKGPAGWNVSSSNPAFSMTRKGENASVRFSITIPSGTAPGSYELKASAKANGQVLTKTMQTIAYDHIQTHRIYRDASSDIKLIDLKTASVKVGYIRGSGDRVEDAIRQIGIDVEEVTGAFLASGDLSRFDTIVVGIRAYQVRQDIVANNKRLMDFVNNGGTLIVQYQLPPSYSQRNLMPFPTQMGPRVVDENAPVTIAEPAHPVLNFPNKIIAEDFAGWVQERNLYNFAQMDPRYVGLLESHDGGDAENRGGLVVAELGKGKYVYCSYSLFRQLPAGVPGAYRLLANLVSLPAANR